MVPPTKKKDKKEKESKRENSEKTRSYSLSLFFLHPKDKCSGLGKGWLSPFLDWAKINV